MKGSGNTYFLTGATGYIGSQLALRLAGDGNIVNALVRNPLKSTMPRHPNIKVFKGDILDRAIIKKAMERCNGAFHLAAFAKPWSKDPDLPRRMNVESTRILLQTAIENGLKKFVFTSSAATIEPSVPGTPSDEDTPRTTGYFNQYDQTKAEAEEVVKAANGNGLETVTVNPSRVYGPGPLTVSNAVSRIIVSYMQGRWWVIPGNGKVIGNYVFIDDVVNGHVLAAYKGKGGDRYILGGEDLTFDMLFAAIGELTGKRRKLIHLPVIVMQGSAWLMFRGARLVNAAPPITPAWIRKYMHHGGLSSRKAEKELGYSITPFKEGAEKTIDWIRKEGLA
jgi:nucleoside-diphosphate-sugar epimerase